LGSGAAGSGIIVVMGVRLLRLGFFLSGLPCGREQRQLVG
jgi:hypothetical protein